MVTFKSPSVLTTSAPLSEPASSAWELSDLEDAISRHKDATDLTSDDHPEHSAYLENLGTSLRTRFERLGQFMTLRTQFRTRRRLLGSLLVITLASLPASTASELPYGSVSSASTSWAILRRQYRDIGMLFASLLTVTLTNLPV